MMELDRFSNEKFTDRFDKIDLYRGITILN